MTPWQVGIPRERVPPRGQYMWAVQMGSTCGRYTWAVHLSLSTCCHLCHLPTGFVSGLYNLSLLSCQHNPALKALVEGGYLVSLQR